jgi:hypothetical protein
VGLSAWLRSLRESLRSSAPSAVKIGTEPQRTQWDAELNVPFASRERSLSEGSGRNKRTYGSVTLPKRSCSLVKDTPAPRF